MGRSRPVLVEGGTMEMGGFIDRVVRVSVCELLNWKDFCVAARRLNVLVEVVAG